MSHIQYKCYRNVTKIGKLMKWFTLKKLATLIFLNKSLTHATLLLSAQPDYMYKI